MKIAVYGTLKQGYGANKYLGNSEFLGETYIKDYALFKDHGLPKLLAMPGSKVVCEVYNVVSPDIQQRLHDYEGFFGENFPNNLYNLKKLEVEGHEDVSVYIFNGTPSEKAELIINGDW